AGAGGWRQAAAAVPQPLPDRALSPELPPRLAPDRRRLHAARGALRSTNRDAADRLSLRTCRPGGGRAPPWRPHPAVRLPRTGVHAGRRRAAADRGVRRRGDSGCAVRGAEPVAGGGGDEVGRLSGLFARGAATIPKFGRRRSILSTSTSSAV